MDSGVSQHELVPFIGTGEKNGVLWNVEPLRDGVYQPYRQGNVLRSVPCRFFHHPASGKVVVWSRLSVEGEWSMLPVLDESDFVNFDRRAAQPAITWSQPYAVKILRNDLTWYRPVFQVLRLMKEESIQTLIEQSLMTKEDVSFCDVTPDPEASTATVRKVLSPLMSFTLAALGVLKA
jgi:hypothetical protein